MSTDLRLIAAGAAVLGAAWWWAVHRKPHEDDDEVYTALFGAQASPVATPPITPTVDLIAADAQATQEAAKELTDLRNQRTTAESQRLAFASVPHL